MAEVKRTDPIAGAIVHEYDGIEEADNALPTWWVAVFIGSMIFAALYWLTAEEFQLVPTPAEELAAVYAERAKRTGQVSEEMLLSASHDVSAVAAGKQAFTTNCVACHGPRGEGNIGPNLTDSSWLHGGTPSQIFVSIRDGVPAKGMPSWGAILGPANVQKVAAYLLTLRGTNIPGKPPQGEIYAGN